VYLTIKKIKFFFYFRDYNASKGKIDFIVFNVRDKTLISMTQDNDFVNYDVLQYNIILNEVFVLRRSDYVTTSIYKLVIQMDH